jgi:hypothetical protein
MTNVQAPPKAEFDNLAGLLDAQRGHLGTLGNYAGSTCANGDGLDNALSFLRQPVADLSTFLNNKFFDCQAGIANAAGNVRYAGYLYHSTDRHAETEIRSVFPSAPSYFPDITGGPSVGSYDDIDVAPEEPDAADEIIKTNLNHVMSALGTVEHIWRWVTGGDSLLERLVTPITGNYGRLKYLKVAYANLSDGTYTIAGNIRRGTYHIAPKWNGGAANEFEYLMFRWHMGIGGLGDLAKVASNVFRDGYATIATLVNAVLDAIGVFINHEIKKLLEAVAGTAAIEAAGGGPEDPVADVIAGGWDLWKIYQAVSAAITAINLIVNLIGKLIEGVKAVAHSINELRNLIGEAKQDPGQLAKDLLNQGLNSAGEVEKDSFWNPTVGAARIGLLPAS